MSIGMLTKTKIGTMIAIAVAGLSACAAPDDEEALGQTTAAASNHDFDVTFNGCKEFVGIGNVPAANARQLVPAHYTLAGDATNAVIVVRVGTCEAAAVDGHQALPTKVAQIGISVTGQDTTADINNYTLWYVTDQPLLAARLHGAGAPAELNPNILFNFTASGTASNTGTLEVNALPVLAPPFVARGPATLPAASPVDFVATWWADGQHGIVASRTDFPAIRFGNAALTLATVRGTALATLIGGTSLTFPLLDSDNTFPAAHMTVRIRN